MPLKQFTEVLQAKLAAVSSKPAHLSPNQFSDAEVLPLHVVHLVYLYAHGGELSARHGLVYLLRDLQRRAGQAAAVLRQILRRKRLYGKAHIHYLRRMSVRGGQVHKAALGDDEQRLALGQLVARDIVPRLVAPDCVFLQAAMSISTSKWPAFVRMAPSFMRPKCSFVMMSRQPVTVQKMSPSFAASRMGMTS